MTNRHLPPGTGDVDLLARVSLPAAFTAEWRSAPERRVFRDVGGPWTTAREILHRTETAARRLHAAGLRPGDRVALCAGTCVAFVVAYCAALRAGFVVVPVNPSYSQREIEQVVAAARPSAAIVESAHQREWFAADVVTGIDIDLPDGPELDLDRSASDADALLLFTSGTTGAPKGVPLSHGNLLASAEAVALTWRWTRHDTLILCLPLFHMHGLGVGLNGTLAAGASALLQDRFVTEAVLSAAADATMFFGVPAMYRMLANAEGADRLATLRLCVSGSAPLSAEQHAGVRKRCGQVVLERYGMTETVMLVSNPYAGERRPGAVGFPLPGVDLRLASETNEIEVRGPNVFSGYLGGADPDAFTADGWFRTGDIGSFDDDGYLSIVGRAKDLIITGGYNVYPREVEDVLREHPSVTDAAVVGTASEEWGEIVTAYVEATDDFDRDRLAAWAAERLAPYKKPRRIHRVDELPRNALGKVIRERLDGYE